MRATGLDPSTVFIVVKFHTGRAQIELSTPARRRLLAKKFLSKTANRDSIQENGAEEMKAIVYPNSLKDIPPWRRRQITQDILWFTRYSPVERLDYVDREWAEIQDFIKKYGYSEKWNQKKK